VGAARLARIPARPATLLVVVGLALIVVAAMLFTDETVFPGAAAIIPVGGAALVILGGLPARSTRPSRLLGIAPMRFLGRVSYSVYLWHWPMLVIGGAIIGEPLPRLVSIAIVLASIPVAAVTQRLVEAPFRIGCFVGVRPFRNLGQALLSSLVIAGLCAAGAVYARGRIDAKLGYLIPPVGAPMPMTGGWCLELGQLDDLTKCTYGNPASDTTVVLFGDSHAEQWFPAFESIALARGWRLVTLAGRCPSLLVITAETNVNPKPDCEAWREHAFARIAKEDPALVVLANFSRTKLEINGAVVKKREAVIGEWERGLTGTLDRLGANHARVVIIGETPLPGVDVPPCLSLHIDDFMACAKPRTAIPSAWHEADRRAAAAAGAVFVDPTPWLCDAKVCPAVIDQYVVYRDWSHLTQPFAASLAPLLEAALPPLQ